MISEPYMQVFSAQHVITPIVLSRPGGTLPHGIILARVSIYRGDKSFLLSPYDQWTLGFCNDQL